MARASDELPTDEEVSGVAEHVTYEVLMLGLTVQAMSDQPPDAEGLMGYTGWALLESHLLHRRALIELLTRSERHTPNDVLISDFRVPGDWPLPRSQERKALLDHKGEIDRFLTHITYTRAASPPARWDTHHAVWLLQQLQRWGAACPADLPWSSELHQLPGIVTKCVEVLVEAQQALDAQLHAAQQGTAGFETPSSS